MTGYILGRFFLLKWFIDCYIASIWFGFSSFINHSKHITVRDPLYLYPSSHHVFRMCFSLDHVPSANMGEVLCSTLQPVTREQSIWFGFSFGCCHVIHLQIQSVTFHTKHVFSLNLVELKPTNISVKSINTVNCVHIHINKCCLCFEVKVSVRK